METYQRLRVDHRRQIMYLGVPLYATGPDCNQRSLVTEYLRQVEASKLNTYFVLTKYSDRVSACLVCWSMQQLLAWT